MLKYLKEHTMDDMRDTLTNNKTPHARSSASLTGKTADKIAATEQRVDILINSAGVHSTRWIGGWQD